MAVYTLRSCFYQPLQDLTKDLTFVLSLDWLTLLSVDLPDRNFPVEQSLSFDLKPVLTGEMT